ncbi:ABC transporter permease [Luteibacter aegosomaticola]|uniref:ABC transporter permease n=1 Tax=Luteibacter aegosomaticola TaxID=2911538 RepID=UPI001FF867A5|nr:ABC transporter permease [Luteibacter aegosomaticola]UPG89413.1 ABC transporter permease [Luteibacter aegosomaticola]
MDFLHIAPNRLLSGHPASPHAALMALAWLVAAAAGFWRGGTAVALVLIIGLPFLAGYEATQLLQHAPPTTRIQLGAGFWTQWLAAALLLLDRLHHLRVAWRTTAWCLVASAFVAGAMAGAFNDIALVREWQAQRGAFADALATHGVLSLVTLGLALVIGSPLGYIAWRQRRAGGALLGVLAFLQTIPSLALFALLIGPFAWVARQWPTLGALGFGGTGAAPAVFALVLYALLPVVRYTVAGLDAVPDDAREAARGLGMSRGQVLWRVQLPLGWPVLLAGLRIVAVQTIGLAAVAALIGAGGLGRFVFLGIGQGATDMVLLGTLAIIVLALAADLLFQGLMALTGRRA